MCGGLAVAKCLKLKKPQEVVVGVDQDWLRCFGGSCGIWWGMRLCIDVVVVRIVIGVGGMITIMMMIIIICIIIFFMIVIITKLYTPPNIVCTKVK